jgi:hypothetical protein
MLVFPLVFMGLDRQLPIVLETGTVDVVSNDEIKITWVAHKQREFGDGLFECQGDYYRRITDSGGFITQSKPEPIQSYKLLDGKISGSFSKELVLPVMLPGPATYQVVTIYWCNPLQKLLLPIVHYEKPVHFIVPSGQIIK